MLGVLISFLATTSRLPMNLWQRPVHSSFLVNLNRILGGNSQEQTTQQKIANKRRAGDVRQDSQLSFIGLAHTLTVSHGDLLESSSTILCWIICIKFLWSPGQSYPGGTDCWFCNNKICLHGCLKLRSVVSSRTQILHLASSGIELLFLMGLQLKLWLKAQKLPCQLQHW